MINTVKQFEESNFESKVTDLRITKMQGFLEFLQTHQNGVWKSNQINLRATQFKVGMHWYKYLLETSNAQQFSTNQIMIDTEYEFTKQDIIFMCQYANYITKLNSETKEEKIIPTSEPTECIEVDTQLKDRILELEKLLEQERFKHQKEISKLIQLI